MTDLFSHVVIGGETLEAQVLVDATLKGLSQACDYDFTGVSRFTVPSMIPPAEYKIGLIVGGSGTGKSSLLKHFGETSSFSWDPQKAVASQVDPSLLMRLGLSSIPSLCRPYHVLSEGEKHRADIARALVLNAPVVDEFTSTVNRDLARSLCIGLRRWFDSNTQKIVLATCHTDVAPWLEPDWVFNTVTGVLVEGRLERPPSHFRVLPCSVKAWSVFSPHHYLSSEINKSAHCWLLVNENSAICGFGSAIPFPSRDLRNAWRGHRTVILPDFQGMGLGSRLSNIVAKMFYDRGCRYFSKTAHPKLGEHRNNSGLWKPTSMNKVSRKNSYQGMVSNRVEYRGDTKKRGAYTSFDYEAHAHRLCYSHEYVGDGTRILKGQEDKTPTPLPLFQNLGAAHDR